MKPKTTWQNLAIYAGLLIAFILPVQNTTAQLQNSSSLNAFLSPFPQTGVCKNFVSPRTPLSISIYAVQQECSYGWAGETVQGGTPPYNTVWEISIDGGSYQTFSAPTFYINCHANLFANFHCTVTDAASATADTYYHLEIGSNYPDKIAPAKKNR